MEEEEEEEEEVDNPLIQRVESLFLFPPSALPFFFAPAVLSGLLFLNCPFSFATVFEGGEKRGERGVYTKVGGKGKFPAPVLPSPPSPSYFRKEERALTKR